MADVGTQYEFKSVTTLRGMEAKPTAKMLQEGWELVTQTPAPLLRTALMFRRPKQKLPKYALPIAGGVILIVAIIITIGALTEGKTPEVATPPVQTEAATSAQPTQAPVTTPTPSPARSEAATPTEAGTTAAAPVTEAEVVAGFEAFFNERRAAGVVIANAVTKITYRNRVVQITFDPAAAGISQARFDYINPFKNLAEFSCTAIAFDDDIGNQLRPAIDRVETVRADGTPLGTLTAAEILKLNGLDG
jgi:hypothetical protein